MARQIIDTTTNNGSYIGDPAKTAFEKTNANFAELYPLAENALPKSGGVITSWITQSGSGVMIGYRMAPTGTGVYGSMFVNNGTEFLLLATNINDVNGGFNSLRPLTINMVNGEVTFAHILNASNGVKSTGYFTRTGTGGTFGSNRYNFNWNGNAEFFIDGTKIGNIAFATSDRRLKRDVEYLDSPEAGDDDIETVLAGRPCTWYYRDVGIWKDDGVQRRSFMADEMQDINSILAPGDRNGEDEHGLIPHNLSADAIISTLWGALRREINLRRNLEERVLLLEKSKL